METVQPIKDKRDINKMKKALHGRDLLMFTMGISFGLRITDLLSIKIGDVRGKDYFIIAEEKTKKKRKITISPEIKKQLAQLDGADEEYIFKSRKGVNKPISRVQAYRVLSDAAMRCGIRDKIGGIGTHSLRKTFGYQLYKKTNDIALVMMIFGHSSPKVSLSYIGITDERISDAYLLIEV